MVLVLHFQETPFNKATGSQLDTHNMRLHHQFTNNEQF